jgi:AbrB family looped-hinge helix DNA binding protein
MYRIYIEVIILYFSKIEKDFFITIPDEIIEQLNLKENDEVEFRIIDNVKILINKKEK